MSEHAEIENMKLPNGKTVKEVNENVRKEVEHYLLGGLGKRRFHTVLGQAR